MDRQDTLTGVSRFREEDARRALVRLSSWYRLYRGQVPSSSTTLGRESAPSRALDALADIEMIRQMLEEVELAGVTSARVNGDSWTQIGRAIGTTKQSAWEKWREIDGNADEP